MTDFSKRMIAEGDGDFAVRLKMREITGDLIFWMKCEVQGSPTIPYDGSYPEENGNNPAWVYATWPGHPLYVQESAYRTYPYFFAQRLAAQSPNTVFPDDITSYSMGVTIKVLDNWKFSAFVYFNQDDEISMGLQKFGVSYGTPNFIWECAGINGNTQIPALNIWYEYLVVVRGSTVKIYRDSVLIDTQSGSTQAPPTVATAGFFATYVGESPRPDSLFKDIKMWNYALSP